jgi:hypothetical protein
VDLFCDTVTLPERQKIEQIVYRGSVYVLGLLCLAIHSVRDGLLAQNTDRSLVPCVCLCDCLCVAYVTSIY